MADERYSIEAEAVEQFPAIDDEIQPVVELMDRIGVSEGGSGMPRRVNQMIGGEPVEAVVVAQPPGAVQKYQWRAAPADLDLRFDFVLPEPNASCLDRRHRAPQDSAAAATARAAP